VTFRARLVLLSAAAVAVAVVTASAVVYVVVRHELYAPIDNQLQTTAESMLQDRDEHPGHPSRQFFFPQPELGGAGGYPQIVQTNGNVILPPGVSVPLPKDASVMDVAAGRRGANYRNAHVNGTHVRILTFQYLPGAAVEIARPLTEVDAALRRIRLLLIAIAASGIAVAAALGLLVARAALGPVRRLTAATEHVTETGDLSERIPVHGSDELSRLATSFNTMLAALEDSTRAQRQLVADASHELRTPLTSLRTNVEVLAGGRELPPGERDRLLNDVIEQTSEMTNLIAELIELARGEQQVAEPEDVRLDIVAAHAVERVRRDRPGVVFLTDLDESVVHGVPASIERAVVNLLDNAAKWSPPGGEVDVRVAGGTVSVRDRGPGIADEDLPFVFDRFYRAAGARGMPGSGLGLAIVRQVAESHGGGVTAQRAEDGGTLMTMRLNGSSNGSANGAFNS
jgi:two-component system, OmpR family, sensor histidine kinase MprB